MRRCFSRSGLCYWTIAWVVACSPTKAGRSSFTDDAGDRAGVVAPAFVARRQPSPRRSPDVFVSRPSDASVPENARRRCVPDYGEGCQRGEETMYAADGGMRRIVHPCSKCFLSATCIEDQRKHHPGDGNLTIACDSGVCTCVFQPHGRTPRSTRSRFRVDSPCDPLERTTELLLGKCTTLLPPRAQDGERPKDVHE